MPVAELLNGGIRLGGGYALMALRLNLVFGVMRDQFCPWRHPCGRDAFHRIDHDGF